VDLVFVRGEEYEQFVARNRRVVGVSPTIKMHHFAILDPNLDATAHKHHPSARKIDKLRHNDQIEPTLRDKQHNRANNIGETTGAQHIRKQHQHQSTQTAELTLHTTNDELL